MNCERAIDLILDSFVEPLSAADQQALDRHLADCGQCRSEANEYLDLQQSLDVVAVPDRPSGGLERLEKAVAKEFGHRAPTQPRRPAWLSVAAAVALVAFGGVFALGVRALIGIDQDAVVADDAQMRFLFIMTETTEGQELSAQADEEIQAWFAGLLEQGVLEAETAVGVGDAVGTPPDGSLLYGQVSGMVVIRAANVQEARRIAVSSPIIRYGGFIEIRSVE